MAKKKQETQKKKVNTSGVMGLVGSTLEQPISETLELNYSRNDSCIADSFSG